MAKLTKDEFTAKYNEKIVDNDDLLIELMEDISDSISTDESEELTSLKNEIETVKNELEAKKQELENLRQKYKERFLNATNETEEPEKEDVEGLKEEEVIDIKEI